MTHIKTGLVYKEEEMLWMMIVLENRNYLDYSESREDKELALDGLDILWISNIVHKEALIHVTFLQLKI